MNAIAKAAQMVSELVASDPNACDDLLAMFPMRESPKHEVSGTPEYNRHKQLMTNYGLTHSEYEDMLEGQGGVCACCGKTPDENKRKLAIDHCHQTNEIRGILCNACNSGIGLLGDNIDALRKAVAYLENAGTGKFMPVKERSNPTPRSENPFPVKKIGVGQTGLISWQEYKTTRPDAEHDRFVKAVRQACYRARPMKFRVAVYDDYEAGCVAVMRVE